MLIAVDERAPFGRIGVGATDVPVRHLVGRRLREGDSRRRSPCATRSARARRTESRCPADVTHCRLEVTPGGVEVVWSGARIVAMEIHIAVLLLGHRRR